jgi:hypothetical protein
VEAIEVFIPGAFETYFDGTGVVAGDPYSTDPDQERGAQELRQAWKERTTFKRGRGYLYGVRLSSIDAALVLAEYAGWCISANYGGDVDHTEVRGARTVLERVTAATSGRITYDGFNVRLDGAVVA